MNQRINLTHLQVYIAIANLGLAAVNGLDYWTTRHWFLLLLVSMNLTTAAYVIYNLIQYYRFKRASKAVDRAFERMNRAIYTNNFSLFEAEHDQIEAGLREMTRRK